MPRKPLAVVSSVLILASIGAAAGASSAAAAGSTAAAAGPALSINVSAGRHAISRDIYGMNFAPARLESQLKLPVVRWGGNATTRYNYLLDTANHASDWYFENIPNTVKNPAALPGGSTADQFIGQNKRDGADSIITVPLVGWTPESRAQTCGFSVAKYGPQQSTDPYDSDCGNGVNTSGQDITGNDPADTSRRAGASFVAKWVGYLDSKYGGAAAGGVRFYQLDNEPDIWFATHRDVHPVGATYSEMLSKTEKVAAAIKATDPAAKTIGPSGWGWSSLFYSGYDQQYCASHSCGAMPQATGVPGHGSGRSPPGREKSVPPG
jgi:Glycoside hydrolase family 44